MAKYLKFLYRIIFFVILILIKFVHATNINILLLGYKINSIELFNDIVNQYNIYSKENNLDITINLNTYSNKNLTDEKKDFLSEVNSIIKDKKSKYDMYLYNTQYLSYYGSNFLNLRKEFSDEHLRLYNQSLNSCLYKATLVGLPLYRDYGVLYCNIKYLEKYNKEIPYTWNEMNKIILDIVKSEAEIGNSLLGYIPNLTEEDTTIASILEFIYSYRRNENDNFPSFTGRNTENALKKIKSIKNTTSSNELFNLNDNEVLNTISSGNALFARTWQLDTNYSTNSDIVKLSFIPGDQDGVSGSAIRTIGISISKYINNEKKKVAIDIIKFFTSYDIQKKITINYNRLSGIMSLYDEKDKNNEICQKVNCYLINRLQIIDIQSIIYVTNFSSLSSKFKEYLFNYLNDTISIQNVQSKLSDLISIHYINSNSFSGILIFIITSITIILILMSYLFLFNKFYGDKLNILNKKGWFLFIFGICMMLCYCYTTVGEIDNLNCFIRPILIIFGFSISILPIIIQLIINFPIKNNISKYFCENQFYIIIIYHSINILIWIIYGYYPLKTEYYVDHYNSGNLNFRRCECYSTLTNIFFIINILFYILLLIFGIFLVFIEWHLKTIRTYSKQIFLTLCFDLMFIIVLTILHFINITNQKYYYLFRILTILLWSFLHFFILYGISIIKIYLIPNNKSEESKTSVKEIIRRSISQKESEISQKESEISISTFRSSNGNDLKTNSVVEDDNIVINLKQYKSGVLSRLMKYHYSTEKKEKRNHVYNDSASTNLECVSEDY
ncbi:periplasmic binding protein-like II [Anaeromyces robustus]|uniref:Periplasmic binding protein-like II n=1 Tax=Anaeromyces robustus TaxID=1754192 RepID=A0A1Y1WZ18_9FUNG|nr:periplasmic binding protein-like II [Anaeromyces robustus]|eukprot:ORX78790.1 periplasmic binding protein-like II [Anaeromyces robustus]